MIKKILPVILSLSLLLCTNVYAQKSFSDTQDVPPSYNNSAQNENVRTSDNQRPHDFAQMQNSQANTPEFSEETPAQNSNIPQSQDNAFNSGWDRNNTRMPQDMSAQSGNNRNTNGGQDFGNMPNFGGQMPNFDGQMPNFGGNMGGGMNRFPGNTQNGTQTEQTAEQQGFLGFVKNNFTPIASAVLLIFAFFFVIFYKRKKF